MKLLITLLTIIFAIPSEAKLQYTLSSKEGLYVDKENVDGDKMADILIVNPCFRWTNEDEREGKKEPLIYYQLTRFERGGLGGELVSTHYGILIPKGNDLIDHSGNVKARLELSEKS
jgi:hypothetical protein